MHSFSKGRSRDKRQNPRPFASHERILPSHTTTVRRTPNHTWGAFTWQREPSLSAEVSLLECPKDPLVDVPMNVQTLGTQGEDEDEDAISACIDPHRRFSVGDLPGSEYTCPYASARHSIGRDSSVSTDAACVFNSPRHVPGIMFPTSSELSVPDWERAHFVWDWPSSPEFLLLRNDTQAARSRRIAQPRPIGLHSDSALELGMSYVARLEEIAARMVEEEDQGRVSGDL
ncbi:unnamed protein product [Mycena citricolor]|uniref:Uncharacterized protein n=1 Tax=Mycena citricolor TaxID=2018698 RepID=A0AAD2K7U2_9AGAR|nr:unnamed protein product [Mycena citricolor]